MFKNHRQAGLAQIVARETHEGQYRRGINIYAPTGIYHHVYDYIADVTPDDETAVFRAPSRRCSKETRSIGRSSESKRE